jgi:hypothetical protein
LPTSTTNQTQANITLTVLDDKKSEGLETIVLLLNPDFPYSLQLSSTTTVLDTSLSVAPDYIINANRTRVVEGSNVTITLITSNISDGTIIPWRIIKQTGDITLGDFDRITSLDGYFPAISSNIANITLEIRDDYLFEQSEFFYIEIPNRNTSSVPIEIIDSGNTYLASGATHTGNVILSFDSYQVPDRYILYFDGNVVIDTGYRGTSDYDYGGIYRYEVTNALSGKIDPVTGNTYPFAGSGFGADNYPRVTSPASGFNTFMKATSTQVLDLDNYSSPIDIDVWTCCFNESSKRKETITIQW